MSWVLKALTDSATANDGNYWMGRPSGVIGIGAALASGTALLNHGFYDLANFISNDVDNQVPLNVRATDAAVNPTTALVFDSTDFAAQFGATSFGVHSVYGAAVEITVNQSQSLGSIGIEAWGPSLKNSLNTSSSAAAISLAASTFPPDLVTNRQKINFVIMPSVSFNGLQQYTPWAAYKDFATGVTAAYPTISLTGLAAGTIATVTLLTRGNRYLDSIVDWTRQTNSNIRNNAYSGFLAKSRLDAARGAGKIDFKMRNPNWPAAPINDD